MAETTRPEESSSTQIVAELQALVAVVGALPLRLREEDCFDLCAVVQSLARILMVLVEEVAGLKHAALRQAAAEHKARAILEARSVSDGAD